MYDKQYTAFLGYYSRKTLLVYTIIMKSQLFKNYFLWCISYYDAYNSIYYKVIILQVPNDISPIYFSSIIGI